MSEADEVSYQFRSSWPVSCTEETQEEIQRQITKRAAQVTSNLRCMERGTCHLNEPRISGCRPGRRRRHRRPRDVSQDDVNQEIDVMVTVTYSGKDTQKKGYYQIYIPAAPSLFC